ncbi:hypothetical protein ACE10Z_06715 [Bradyrhizobium sp. Pha-3]|uniref:hypothetical protein n=1 Tax=Bradyrhizobium sp. Pha-3 TaxID=208375 RepID=UPI0035D40395
MTAFLRRQSEQSHVVSPPMSASIRNVTAPRWQDPAGHVSVLAFDPQHLRAEQRGATIELHAGQCFRRTGLRVSVVRIWPPRPCTILVQSPLRRERRDQHSLNTL